MSKIAPAVIGLAALAASPAIAHVTLEKRQAPVGSYYKAVFAVPHGCAGSATVKLRVQIPEGVIGIKPMPKPGWTLEAVKEVVWSGGKLADDNFDEFVFSSFLTAGLKPDTTLYFPVVQECEQGVSRWIDIPAEGPSGHGEGSKTPAPGLKLIAKP